MLWDLNEGKHLYTLDGGDIINALCFSPNRYWLCAATGPSIKIWVSVICSIHGTLTDWQKPSFLSRFHHLVAISTKGSSFFSP
jgi:hypothetical protein